MAQIKNEISVNAKLALIITLPFLSVCKNPIIVYSILLKLNTLTQILVTIADDFVCDATTAIKESKKCDGVYDCPGEDEKQGFCEHFRQRNQSKFESSERRA